ncbi:hypothetical protein ANN_04161 [Periplaneta americana]|uniref:Uncharacterized protein n=1 Tax=Periplaneta americana TaxID=6978 RepID=A0ABQ8T7U0_PERAM|nr:hypothetical protein ANN_04161 [Periplaneta americana]
MAGLYEGGNEPSGSLKVICKIGLCEDGNEPAGSLKAISTLHRTKPIRKQPAPTRAVTSRACSVRHCEAQCGAVRKQPMGWAVVQVSACG